MRSEQLFVGRVAERAAFARARSAASHGAPRIVLVHGPPGVGKTTLLHAFADDAQDDGFHVELVHADELGTLPAAFGESLAARLRPETRATAKGLALLIDGWESRRSLEDFAHALLLREAAGSTIVVLAGREAPGAGVRASPSYGSTIVPMPLRALGREESFELLERRGVRPDRRGAIVDFAHGCPLALALAADAAGEDASSGIVGPPADSSIVGVLWDHFFATIPDDDARAALEICAVLRTTDEESIAELAPDRDARRAFDWLSGLSFVERTRDGLYLHDLARELAVREMKWRNRSHHRDLVQRAFRHLAARAAGGRSEVHAMIASATHLLRELPEARAHLIVPPDLELGIDACDAAAFREIRSILQRYDGEDEAAVAAHWFERQPEAFTIARARATGGTAFVVNLRLDRTTAADRERDPVVARAWRWVEQRIAGRVPGSVYFARHWGTEASYQTPCPELAVCGVLMVEPFVRDEDATFAFQPFCESFVQAASRSMALFEIAFVKELAFTAGGSRRLVGVYDRRGVSGVDWFGRIVARTLAHVDGAPELPPARPAAPLALAYPDFAAAVREALRALRDHDRLAKSPLVDAPMVLAGAAGAAGATRDERASALRAIVLGAIDALDGDAAPLRNVLRATYVSGASSQEEAAAATRLAYGTFRRYLARAHDRVIDRLWRLDGGAERA